MTDETTPAPDTPETDAAQDPAANAEQGFDLDRLNAELGEWRDKALRAAADAENTRRRAEREMNDARAYAIQRFARDLLDAADNLERAMKAAPRDSADAAVTGFITGVEMTEKALQTAFERNGLKKLEPNAGDKFDPHLHQAMLEQPAPDGVAPGAVIQTVQAGYELFGRVVRPAMVVVAGKPAAASDGAGAYAGAADPAGASVDTKA